MKQIGRDAPGRFLEMMEGKNVESVINMSRHSRGSGNGSSHGNDSMSFRRSTKLESALDRMRDRIEMNAFQGKSLSTRGRESPGPSIDPLIDAGDDRDEAETTVDRENQRMEDATREKIGEAILEQGRDNSPTKPQRQKLESNSLFGDSSSEETKQNRHDRAFSSQSPEKIDLELSTGPLSPTMQRRRSRSDSLPMPYGLGDGTAQFETNLSPDRGRKMTSRGRGQSLENEMMGLLSRRGNQRARSSSNPRRSRRGGGNLSESPGRRRPRGENPLLPRGALSIPKDQKDVSDASSLSGSSSSSGSNTGDETTEYTGSVDEEPKMRNETYVRDGRRESIPILPKHRTERSPPGMNWDSLVAAASSMVPGGLLPDPDETDLETEANAPTSTSEYVSTFVGKLLLGPDPTTRRNVPSPVPTGGRKSPDGGVSRPAPNGSKREKEKKAGKVGKGVKNKKGRKSEDREKGPDSKGRDRVSGREASPFIDDAQRQATRDKKRGGPAFCQTLEKTMEEQCGLPVGGIQDALCGRKVRSQHRNDDGDLESVNTLAMKDNSGLCGFLSILTDAGLEERDDRKHSEHKKASQTPKKGRRGEGKRQDENWDGVSTLCSTLDDRVADEQGRGGRLNKRRPIPVEITTTEKPIRVVKQTINPAPSGGTEPEKKGGPRQEGSERQVIEPVVPDPNKGADPFVELAISSDSEENQQAKKKPVMPVTETNGSTRRVLLSVPEEQSAASLSYSLATTEGKRRPPLSPPASSAGKSREAPTGQAQKSREGESPFVSTSGDFDSPPNGVGQELDSPIVAGENTPGPIMDTKNANPKQGIEDTPSPMDKKNANAKQVSNGASPSKSGGDLKESKPETRKVSSGIAGMVARFERLHSEGGTEEKLKEPSLAVETVQTTDPSPLATVLGAGSVASTKGSEEDGELLLAVTRSETDELAVALSLSPTSIELSRFSPSILQKNSKQPEKPEDPPGSANCHEEIIVTKPTPKTDETPAYVSHQDELFAKIRAYQERKAAKKTMEGNPNNNESAKGGPSKSDALISNSSVKGRKIAQSYIEALSKKPSKPAYNYIEAVSKKQSSAGRVLASPGPSKDGNIWLTKVLENKKKHMSPTSEAENQWNLSSKSDQSGKKALSPPHPEMRSSSVPRTRPETVAAEAQGSLLRGDSPTSRLHAALFDDTTISTGLISDTDEVIRARQRLYSRSTESPRTASSGDLVDSRMSGASSSAVSLSLGAPRVLDAKSEASGDDIANIPHSVSFNKTSSPPHSGAVLSSGNPQYEQMSITQHLSAASSAIFSKGDESSLDVGNLMSRIDHVVHRLIRSGKIDIGNAESENVDLHERTLRNNTAELLENLAILRGRRSAGGSLDQSRAFASKGTKVIEREIEEQYEGLEAALSGLERRESALQSPDVILRARRELAASEVAPDSDAGAPKDIYTDPRPQARDPTPPSPRNVDLDNPAFESSNIAKLRALRAQAEISKHPHPQKIDPSTPLSRNLDADKPASESNNIAKLRALRDQAEMSTQPNLQKIDPSPPSSRNVDVEEPAFESSNIAKLRARRDQAAKIIQDQAQKLVSLTKTNPRSTQPKPNEGHQRLPQKPASKLKKTEHHSKLTATSKKTDQQPVLKPALKQSRIGHQTDPPTQENSPPNKRPGPPKPEGSGPIRPPDRTVPGRKSNPISLEDYDIQDPQPPVISSSPSGTTPTHVHVPDSSVSSCSSLQSSARDTNHRPSHEMHGTTALYRGPILQQMVVHEISTPPGSMEPKKQSGMSGWEQAELRKLPMLLRSATSNSNPVNLSDEDESYESDDDSDMSSEDSDDDSERLERIEGMIQELRERRSRIKA